jgi:hypothetical protein
MPQTDMTSERQEWHIRNSNDLSSTIMQYSIQTIHHHQSSSPVLGLLRPSMGITEQNLSFI